MPANLPVCLPACASPALRLGSTVVNGIYSIVTNFGAMSGQLSGPVAVVAAGSKIARTDAAGLFQFCALVNINLAVINILPLPVGGWVGW